MSWKDIKTRIHFSQCLHLDIQQIARPLFIHALPEWQKTTAQSAIPGASIIQGVVSKGYEVSKSLAHVLYLQLNSLVNLCCDSKDPAVEQHRNHCRSEDERNVVRVVDRLSSLSSIIDSDEAGQ